MDRRISDRNILDEFCINFCKILEKHCKYIVVSGFVAISSGRTRGTEDIDVIIEKLPLERFIILHNDLIKNGFVCMQTEDVKSIYKDYLDDNLSVRYTFKDMMLPEMEVKFAKDELDNYQLKKRIKRNLSMHSLKSIRSLSGRFSQKRMALRSSSRFTGLRMLKLTGRFCQW